MDKKEKVARLFALNWVATMKLKDYHNENYRKLSKNPKTIPKINPMDTSFTVNFLPTFKNSINVCGFWLLRFRITFFTT